MLTKIETQVLFWIYTVCCKFLTIPYTWKGGRMMLKLNGNPKFYSYCTWILLVAMIIFNFVQLQVFIDEKDINASILQGSFVISYLGFVMCKLNVWLYSSELVLFINQVLYMNSFWGKYSNITQNTNFKILNMKYFVII